VIDDVPTAHDNARQNIAEDGVGTLSGNLIIDDNANPDPDVADVKGADDALLKEFTYRDDSGVNQTVSFVDGNNVVVHTETGDLTINRNGDWSFSPVVFDHDDNLDASESLLGVADSVDEATNASFRYTLIDSDGDETEAKQIINITDEDVPTIGANDNVKVYEGGDTFTFDGNNYDESNSDDTKGTTATASNKLRFDTGSDQAGITSITWEGHTVVLDKNTATATSSMTIDTTGDAVDKGILIVKYDGTWEYEAPAIYTHDAGNDIGGSQTIQVDDTIATISATTDVSLDEDDLATGTSPDEGALTQTGTITVDDQYLNGANHTVRFKATQTDTILTVDNIFG